MWWVFYGQDFTLNPNRFLSPKKTFFFFFFRCLTFENLLWLLEEVCYLSLFYRLLLNRLLLNRLLCWHNRQKLLTSRLISHKITKHRMGASGGVLFGHTTHHHAHV